MLDPFIRMSASLVSPMTRMFCFQVSIFISLEGIMDIGSGLGKELRCHRENNTFVQQSTCPEGYYHFHAG